MNIPVELRCYCKSTPLLAVCGRDSLTGDPFVHVKSVRNGNINAEVIAHEGMIRIRCKRCQRWHTVTIKRVSVEQVAEKLPATVSV